MSGRDGRVRVCIPIGGYPPVFTGQGIQIQRSLPYLRSRGIDATILTCRLPRSFPASTEAEADGVDRTLSPGWDYFPTLLRVGQFRRYFNRRRGAFDVLHSNMLAWEFLLNLRRLKALGLPVILEMVLLGGDDPLTTSLERLGAFKMRLLRQVDLWIGLSGAFLPRLVSAGIPSERFRVVYPGVDVEGYRPLAPEERREIRARLGLPVEARITVSVGSVLKRKGFDRVLAAWEHLRPVSGRDLLVVVGPQNAAEGLPRSDLAFAREIREWSEKPGLRGTVRWAGRAAHVNEYLGAADLFLFLSRQEGLGIVIIEALSCGLPCVLSPLDGISAEIVSSGENGVILDNPDDPAEVASRVSRLLDRPGERAAMGEAARRRAVSRFSFEVRADALASLYRDLISNGSKGQGT